MRVRALTVALGKPGGSDGAVLRMRDGEQNAVREPRKGSSTPASSRWPPRARYMGKRSSMMRSSDEEDDGNSVLVPHDNQAAKGARYV